jgi:putative peptide zinc metalloprotease protein
LQTKSQEAQESGRAAATNGAPPKLADGIELIGEYEDSGFKEPPSIARRADGQVIQLPSLLYVVAERIDGRRSYAQIAEDVTEAIGRGVAPDDIKFLVKDKLAPLGIAAGPDGQSPELKKADPMLALKFRVAVVPERVVHAITTLFYPFFFPPVIALALAALVAFDVWMLFFHGIAQGARSIVYNPLLLFMMLGLVIVATTLHEIGHATAARYGGAKPGVMGAGIYVVWPAFYTDVTDAYRLSRIGRLRTDLGGIYFNALFALGTAGVYLLTGFEPLLIVVLVQHFQIIQQLLPFLRLDGYYILSDLTGVPDLFNRIKPTLTSLLPGKSDERVSELKPWVRVVVIGWVLLLVPVLLFVFGSILMNAPRIFATAYDSLLVHYDQAKASFHEGRTSQGVLSSVQMATLALPALGMALSTSRAGTQAFRGGWRWSEGAPMRRFGLISGTAALIALLGFVWYPNGEYKPIQPGERGTIRGAVAQFGQISTGRPSLTADRENQLGGAPTLHDSSGSTDQRSPTSTSPTSTTTLPTTTTEPTTTATNEPTTTNNSSTSTTTTPGSTTTTRGSTTTTPGSTTTTPGPTTTTP